MPPDRDEALRWATVAEDDWEYALAGMERFPRGAGWNFHQTAEKYLKALLLLEGQEPPRTHDLLHLLGLAEPDVDPSGEIATAASALAPFGVSSRYPGDLAHVTPEGALRAREAAAAIRRFSRNRLGLA